MRCRVVLPFVTIHLPDTRYLFVTMCVVVTLHYQTVTMLPSTTDSFSKAVHYWPITESLPRFGNDPSSYRPIPIDYHPLHLYRSYYLPLATVLPTVTEQIIARYRAGNRPLHIGLPPLTERITTRNLAGYHPLPSVLPPLAERVQTRYRAYEHPLPSVYPPVT